MADTIIGIVGKDYVLLAADATANFSIIVMKQNEDKIYPMDNNKLLAGCGEAGDRVQFCEYIEKNLSLYRHMNDRALSTKAAAHFLRGELAEALRQNPYYVNLLLAGVDSDGPSLYYIDYLASCARIEYGAHGYGSYFTLSILDKNYKKDMTLEEGKALMSKCIKEVQKRLLLNTPQFVVKVVDKNGIRLVNID